MLLFTSFGKVHARKAYQIPEASRTAKGTNIVNVLELFPEEKITAMISVEGFNEGEYLTMVTKKGIIKRTLLTEYEYQRKGGKIAILGALASGKIVPASAIHTEGIRAIRAEDVAAAERIGCSIKLLGRYLHVDGGDTFLLVAPFLLPSEYQVMLAALLSVALGIVLNFRKKTTK